jgi:hypothetical protein
VQASGSTSEAHCRQAGLFLPAASSRHTCGSACPSSAAPIPLKLNESREANLMQSQESTSRPLGTFLKTDRAASTLLIDAYRLAQREIDLDTPYFLARIRRRHSNNTTPAATDTFNDGICPAMGIRTSTSQCSRTS